MHQPVRSRRPTPPAPSPRPPGLPAGFSTTFSSRLVTANGIRQHVVIGGEGPPVLLVHGWPENWYAWRHVMPDLAQHHTVVAVDQRGMGLSDKPDDGYDAGTLARDLAALMDELGHDRFALVGHDTGMVISYALAADFPRARRPGGTRRGARPAHSGPLSAAVRSARVEQPDLAHRLQPCRRGGGAARRGP